MFMHVLVKKMLIIKSSAVIIDKALFRWMQLMFKWSIIDRLIHYQHSQLMYIPFLVPLTLHWSS